MDDQAIDTPPLHGIRVLEFSQIVAGPVTGLNLADLGADVIKVETTTGDAHRYVGTTVPGESKMFQGNNRGKRGLAVDLGKPQGLAIIHRLAPTIDVVISNFRPGVPERLGIDYETLKKLRPDIIYGQISGFGERGPGVAWAGSDLAAQAYSGLMVSEGKLSADGVPQRLEVPFADYAAGMGLAMAICAALVRRNQTGQGQYISTSLLRAALQLQNRVVMREPVSDVTLRDPRVAAIREARERAASFSELFEIRSGRAQLASPFTLYYRVYRARDGAVALGALTPPNRNAIRRVLGIFGKERSDEPDFDAADPTAMATTMEWRTWIEQEFLARGVEEWVRLFLDAGVPAAPVNFPEEMTDDPQANADGMFLELEHTVTGAQKVVGPLVEMPGLAIGHPRAAPSLGEHTQEILAEAGMTDEEIELLRQSSIIVG